MNFLKKHPSADLGGTWSFAHHPGPITQTYRTLTELAQAKLELAECRVPGNFELDLQANGEIGEPFFGLNILGLVKYERDHVWYGRSFRAKPKPGMTAELVFEGLDCYADVYLNGELLGSTDNMLIEHVFDVTGRLKDQNELFVHITPAVEAANRYEYPAGLHAGGQNVVGRYEALYVRKAPHMYGWDIMPRAVSAGIWRPVKIRYRPPEKLEAVYLETAKLAADHNEAQLRLQYRVRTAGGPEDAYELAVEGSCGSSSFSERVPLRFDAGCHFFSLPAPRLWWPAGYGPANLYDVTIRLLKNGQVVDRQDFTFGLRTVQLKRTDLTTPAGEGEFCFLVNGERTFAKGSNWVPVDAYHSRDAARIPAIVDLAEAAHCNILRCWGGSVYEDDLFYDLCDRKGIMVWQDFAMACALYPQDEDFRRRLAVEARQIIRRLRQHACVVLWAGDNECDLAHRWSGKGDANQNALTRHVLPAVLREEDPARPYLPSSPYIAPAAWKADERLLPEDHLWGPRNYYKSDYYLSSQCHFVSEIGYHGMPNTDSLRRFISPGKLWPYQGNDEWLLHSTSADLKGCTYRVELMAKQIRALFGTTPDNLEDYVFASQASQAEAKKFFIELFRGGKWRRTGIIWWNLMDGWPQMSDAVVDYYFGRKLAYDFIVRAQAHVLVLLREPREGFQQAVVVTDTRAPAEIDYTIKDVDTGVTVASGRITAAANDLTVLARIPYDAEAQRFYVIEWNSALGPGKSHYLAGKPPFDLARYCAWLEKAGLSKKA